MSYTLKDITNIKSNEKKITIRGRCKAEKIIKMDECHKLEELICQKTDKIILHLSPQSLLCRNLYDKNLLNIVVSNKISEPRKPIKSIFELNAFYETDAESINAYNNLNDEFL